MQENIENKTINLAVSTSKLAGRQIIALALKGLKAFRQHRKDKHLHGKMTVRRLIKKDQGVSSMDVSKTDLKGFTRYARKYGVDYAVRRQGTKENAKYLVFFKARDADALAAAFQEYMSGAMNRKFPLKKVPERKKEEINKERVKLREREIAR